MLLAIALASTLTIIDGDTIRDGDETIRIANIDTAETEQAKCDAERRLGLVAKARLEQLLASGKVEIVPGDPGSGRTRDPYDRLLATVKVDGRDVGEILVDELLARPWNGKREPWCESLHGD